MAYSGITVSGHDSAFKVDAVQMSDGDARQILSIGTGTSTAAGIGNLAHVEASAMFVKDVQLSTLTANESRSKAQAVSGVVGVSAINNWHSVGIMGVSGAPSATISNVTHSVSSTSYTLSAAGGAPSVTTLIPAPGAGKSVMVHGTSVVGFGSTSTSYGFFRMYFNTATDAQTVSKGIILGNTVPTVVGTTLPFPLKCGTNKAVAFEVTEQNTHIYCTITIYHSEITL